MLCFNLLPKSMSILDFNTTNIACSLVYDLVFVKVHTESEIIKYT